MAVDTRVIERTITIQAPPETVFRLLTDPTEYVRWKGRLARLEAKPGGIFHVEFADPAGIASGRYVEVVPGRREIGRASCRERVEVAGGGGEWKRNEAGA